jgi:hypothetical protein
LVSEYLSGEPGRETLGVQAVGLNEGGKVVGSGRRDDVEWIFVELEISLFPVAEG